MRMSFLTFEDLCTPWLSFKSTTLAKDYVEFCESRIAESSTWMVLVMYAFIDLLETLSYRNRPVMRTQNILFLAVITMYVVLLVLGLHVIQLRRKENASYHRKMMECLLSVGLCFEQGLLFIAGDLQGSDSKLSLVLSHDLVLIMMTPLLLSIVFHSTDWFTTFLCWICGIFFMCGLYWSSFTGTTLLALLMYVFLSLVLSYEYRRQSLSKFLLSLNLKLLIQENELMADELHANEMRHMIANVAHDLKTVQNLMFASS